MAKQKEREQIVGNKIDCRLFQHDGSIDTSEHARDAEIGQDDPAQNEAVDRHFVLAVGPTLQLNLDALEEAEGPPPCGRND